MEYALAVDDAPDSVPGGTGILLLHPSIGETDRIDTDFFKTDTDRFLVVSTRTTAREVEQKLEHYAVDESRADILDTISVERGYSRRGSDRLHYVAAPDDLDGIVAKVEAFLDGTDGKRRLSVDSLTEMAYYADVDRTYDAAEQMLALLDTHDAVGLFHLSNEVHDEQTIDRFRGLFDAVIELSADGTVRYESN
jgi:KaiC/GvpD/RAD55 family RecA-like ATPase